MSNRPRRVFIEGSDGLVRDTHSMGISNTNTHALNMALRQKEEAIKKLAKQREEQAAINTMCKDVTLLNSEVSQMKSEFGEMKSMLSAILNKLGDK